MMKNNGILLPEILWQLTEVNSGSEFKRTLYQQKIQRHLSYIDQKVKSIKRIWWDVKRAGRTKIKVKECLQQLEQEDKIYDREKQLKEQGRTDFYHRPWCRQLLVRGEIAEVCIICLRQR